MLLYAPGFTSEEVVSEYGVSDERARALVCRARRQLRALVDPD